MRYRNKILKVFIILGLSLLLAFSSVQPAVAQTWIELTPVGSPPNPVFTPKPIHYDAANNRLIAFFPGSPPFGGVGNQVWILTNPNGLGGPPTWTQLQPQGSPPSSNGLESVVYDASTNRLIVYGGCFANCSPALSNVFVLTNANGLGGTPVWSQISVNNPQARTHHSAVYDPQNNLMIAFGGHFAFFGTDQNDTRVLSNANGLGGVSTWTTLSISGAIPPIRNMHTTVYDAVSNRMILYAGANYQKNYNWGFPWGNMTSTYDDLWILATANGLGTPTWLPQTPLGTVPPGRFGHSAVYDPTQNRMFVFGGTSITDFTTQTSTRLGDLWKLSHANGLTGTPTWNQLSQAGTLPGPRFYHTAAFDAANQRMILLGGRDQNDVPSNRVWVLVFTVPFAAFTPEVEIELGPEGNDDEAEVKGSFTLGSGNDGIDPLTEDVTLEVGPFSTTIPAGSFVFKPAKPGKKGKPGKPAEYKFKGVIGGITLKMKITVLGGAVFDFKAKGEDADLTATANPVTVKLTIGDDTGTTSVTAKIEVDDDDHLDKTIADAADEGSLPEGFTLFQNYPNPFNPETEIRFQIPQASPVVVRIFNTLGQEIRRLADREFESGFHTLRWDGKDNNGNPLSSGVYLYQLNVGGFSQVRKMSLLR